MAKKRQSTGSATNTRRVIASLETNANFGMGTNPRESVARQEAGGLPSGDNHGYCWDFQQHGECNADQNCRFWHGDQPPGKRWGGDILGDRHTEDPNEGEHESYFQEVENEESIDVNTLD